MIDENPSQNIYPNIVRTDGPMRLTTDKASLLRALLAERIPSASHDSFRTELDLLDQLAPGGAFQYGAVHELLEIEGIMGAPHLARAYWVALERWDSLRPREIEEELTRAHALIYEKLPKRTKSLLALPQKQRPKGIKEGKNSRAKSLVVPRAKK